MIKKITVMTAGLILYPILLFSTGRNEFLILMFLPPALCTAAIGTPGIFIGSIVLTLTNVLYWLTNDISRLRFAILLGTGISVLNAVGLAWFFRIVKGSREKSSARAIMSAIDELTGLYNHDHILEVLDEQVNLCERYNEIMTICHIGLDRLTKINELYGWESGNSFLKAVAESINRSIRKTDIVGRINGDEFLIIFVRCRIADADGAVRRMLHDVSTQTIYDQHLDFSFGYSEYNPGAPQPSAEILKEAQARMQRQKRHKKEAEKP